MNDRVDLSPKADTLPRRLGVFTLVLTIVAFNAPLAAMAGFVQLSIGFGNGIGAPVSFLVAGVILLIFAIGFVGMSRFIDEPGAFYRYITAGMGRSAGFAGAFLATAAYILLCASSYPYIGLVAVDLVSRVTGGSSVPWHGWAFFFLIVISIIGLFRIDLSMRWLGKLVCLEVALVAIWEAAVMIRGGPEGYSLSSFAPSRFFHSSTGLGVMFAMMTMIGIESAACLSAETIDPERAVPKATVIAITFIALFYGLGTWCYIVTQGASKAVLSASTDPVGSFFSSVQVYGGAFFVKAVSLAVVTSEMVAIVAVQTSASRYLFSLAQEKVLPSSLSRVHRRLQSPHVAIITNSAISLTILIAIVLLKLSPVASYAALSGLGIYLILPLLIATSVSVVVFYYKGRPPKKASRISFIAPAFSALSMSVLFLLASLNLKILVGTPTMVVASLAAVVIVPFAGWALAGGIRNARRTSFVDTNR